MGGWGMPRASGHRFYHSLTKLRRRGRPALIAENPDFYMNPPRSTHELNNGAVPSLADDGSPPPNPRTENNHEYHDPHLCRSPADDPRMPSSGRTARPPSGRTAAASAHAPHAGTGYGPRSQDFGRRNRRLDRSA